MLQGEFSPINGKHIRISLSFSKIEEYRARSNFMPYGSVLVCFDDSGDVFSDEYVVCWSQARTKYNEVVFDDETTERYVDEFRIDFDKLPNSIQGIQVFSMMSTTEEFDVIATVFSDEKKLCTYQITLFRGDCYDHILREICAFKKESAWFVRPGNRVMNGNDFTSMIEKSNTMR